MTKPAITKRETKGSALTYTELDTNFQNLADATLTVTDGTNSKALNLNDTLTFTAGSNITIGVNSSTGAVTITGSGSGSVNSGAANALAYYPSSGSTIDDARLTYSYNGTGGITVDAVTDSLVLAASGLQLDAGGSSVNPVAVVINYGGIFTSAPSSFSVTPGQPAFSTGTATTYANNDYVDFSEMSGMIMINRQDASSGNVALWLCGGAGAVKLGDSHGDESGTITYNATGPGSYRWVNNTGGTVIVSFFAVKTRGAV